MIALDSDILQFLNTFAQKSALLDRFVACIESNDLFKGGFYLPVFWGLWFSKKDNRNVRELLLSTIIAALAALVIARVLADLLPFRGRPLFNAELHFIPPFGLKDDKLESWSAFPSDHAVFFFALATGIRLIEWRVGNCLLLYTIVAICLPRIYFGLHHPTDILAGAVLGIVAVVFACREQIRKKLTKNALACEEKYPEIFYASAFVITFQMVVLFYNIRDLGHRLLSIL